MSAGVESSTLGSLEWMTPIVEMPIEKVTKAEAESYEQWRRGYERNWRWAFDPIGLRISLGEKKLAEYGAELLSEIHEFVQYASDSESMA